MGKKVETQDLWVWNQWGPGPRGPRQVAAIPAGKMGGQTTWVVISDDPDEQGKSLYERTSCFFTAEECIAYQIRDAESTVTSAQRRLDEVKRAAEKWRSTESVS